MFVFLLRSECSVFIVHLTDLSHYARCHNLVRAEVNTFFGCIFV